MTSTEIMPHVHKRPLQQYYSTTINLYEGQFRIVQKDVSKGGRVKPKCQKMGGVHAQYERPHLIVVIVNSRFLRDQKSVILRMSFTADTWGNIAEPMRRGRPLHMNRQMLSEICSIFHSLIHSLIK